MTEFPIQPAKVQPPTLRESTLRRDRLLDWLNAKIHHRVVFVIAEAGYGKTTLLADFARRTRLRTLWYRLDEEDRDWISVLNYLVAAGRRIDPAFAPSTGRLLREIGTGGATREAIVDTFVRELSAFEDGGAVLILDDYHLVDDAPDVRALMREIVTRGPERLTVVFSSRRRPTVPVARLRALGELVELRAGDLRFDEAETERLFREAYGTPLESDVLADLNRRTEGWAASLQLVQAAIRDRTTSEIRSFVRGLSGAQAELHDYLAEEVVGDLDLDLQGFLMATSILQSVDVGLASVAAGVDAERAADLADRAEALGLLPADRRGGGSRYHPLVRDFLEARLRREVGGAGVVDLHRRVARHAEGHGWRTAAHHYLAAGDLADVHRVVASSTHPILGGGEFALAESYIDHLSPELSDPSFDIIRSRMELHRDRVPLALERARAAAAAFPEDSTDPNAHVALANLMTVEFYAGNLDITLSLARHLAGRGGEPALAAIAEATIAMLLASTDGNLDRFRVQLSVMLEVQERNHEFHFAGITHLNLAGLAKAQGDAGEALLHAEAALDSLSRSSEGHEVPSARLLRAWALAHTGRWEAALGNLDVALAAPHGLALQESMVEAADIHDWYSSAEAAEDLLQSAPNPQGPGADVWRVSRAQNLTRLGRYSEASSLLGSANADALTKEFAHKSRHLFVRALLARLSDQADAAGAAQLLLEQTRMQGARFWDRLGGVLAAFGGAKEELDAAVGSLVERDRSAVNLLAEVLAPRLHALAPETRSALSEEIRLRPGRWRTPLRAAIELPDPLPRLAAAVVLNEVGVADDIPRLRRLGREAKGHPELRHLGTDLAKRLAPRVFVEDQGRVAIHIGDEVVPGTAIRRKVLALLCFLLTRRDLSATRDQVLEALWPDLEPEVGANSLNQTVYFLRRVFEPEYREDTSPAYVHHDSDVLWLDRELVDSRSRLCRRLIDAVGVDPTRENVGALSGAYLARFALDFAYEEWSAAYRDSLHASYLEIVETAIAASTNGGDFQEAIAIARRAVDVDPEAEHLELNLLRLYRLFGAHAAAAEQYAHYSSVMRSDLGVEPPPLDSL